jgi:hypothetical protein
MRVNAGGEKSLIDHGKRGEGCGAGGFAGGGAMVWGYMCLLSVGLMARYRYCLP